MAQAPPILVWQPGGGVSSPIGSNPPVYSQAGTTVLIEDQGYVDVVFGSIQTDDEWILTECIVVNETDVDPLNLWPGIITDKTGAGFRIYFNGLPDSGNYYLHWAVSGINIEPSEATMYLLSGPATGSPGEASTFTVSLPPSTYVTGSVIVTPSEGGLEIGGFSPETVTLTADSPSQTFTFTPALYGDTTITVNNDRGLTDPVDLTFSSLAATYTFSGPSEGDAGVSSSDFTVELPAGGIVAGTVTVTPSDGAGGTFTPTTATLTTVAPSDTFTYTPLTVGEKTLSVGNDGGLTDPEDLSYTATTPPLVDGDRVATWIDSSVNGNDAIASGIARPTYKTAILNGKPVVRYSSVGLQRLTLTTPISGDWPWTIIAVMKPVTGTGNQFFGLFGNDVARPLGPRFQSDYSIWDFIDRAGGNYYLVDGSPGTAHVVTVTATSAGVGSVKVDGAGSASSGATSANTGDFINLGAEPGDLAELVVYNVALGSTDRANVEKYLGTKYAITVAGGSAVDPDTVSGIKGWWKADAIE